MNQGQRKKRTNRVKARDVQPGSIFRVLERLKDYGILLRLGMCLLGALLIWGVTVPHLPPFAYRSSDIPRRDILSIVPIKVDDLQATQDAQDEAARQVRFIYRRDPGNLLNLRGDLKNTLEQLLAAPSRPRIWSEFLAPDQPSPPADQQDADFAKFQKALAAEGALDRVNLAVANALKPYEDQGLLDKLPEAKEPGSREEISVLLESPEVLQTVKVADVLLGQGQALRERLSAQVELLFVADAIYNWVMPRLRPTLKLDRVRTQEARQRARANVDIVQNNYDVGQTLARAGEPLGERELELLQAEHAAVVNALTPTQQFLRAAASLGMILALFTMCGYYVVFHEPQLFRSLKRLAVILALAVSTVALARWFSIDKWRAELIPLMLFAITVTIVYSQELSLLMSICLCVVIVFDLGLSLGHFIVMMGTASTAIFMLRRIRSRSKLITVGACTGLVAFALSVGVGILEGTSKTRLPVIDPYFNVEASDSVPNTSPGWNQFERLAMEGGRYALWALAAGFLISGALPFVETHFDVVTDISLLELGDVSHPLLQELVRRAPGTYNHSITVASIGDAAAEAIGANGLLVRVGAYFHDIGKMLKPSYFIENQGSEVNKHESLVPAMSALIIIAHVKDGADLARQHGLPEPIIDFIEQHHGTTLVEYFYHQANRRQQEDDPNAPAVLESDFRYPGPKPQSKEAAVMMVSDAVESASRVLPDPTPSRIRNLVRGIAMKRLLDGQFDECGLSLKELHAIEDSLVKSLTAVYHSRVKYPEQKSA